MRIVAQDARLLRLILVRFSFRDVFLVVAFKTELAGFFDEQLRLVGLMSVMTGSTFAIGGGVVFKGRFFYGLLKIFMALVA